MPNSMKRLLRSRTSSSKCIAFEQQQQQQEASFLSSVRLSPATGGRQTEWHKMKHNSPMAISFSTLTTASLGEDWSSHHGDDDDDEEDFFNNTCNQDEEEAEAEDDGFGVMGASTQFGEFGDFVSAADQQEKDFALNCLDGDDHMTESRRKLADSGFSWNRAKMVKMLSSRSLISANESDDDEQNSQFGSFADDLSVVHSVGTTASEYTMATEYISDLSAKLRDRNDHDSVAADELKDLPDSEIADRFVKMQKKLNRRRKKFRKSRSKGIGKSCSLDLTSLADDDDEEATARRVREHKKERKSTKKGKSNRKHKSSKLDFSTIE